MFESPKMSLSDVLGRDYVETVARASAFLGEPIDAGVLEKVDFYPEERQRRSLALLSEVGKPVSVPFTNDMKGAPTNAYARAAHPEASPLTGLDCYRVGESGKLYLLGKSEHYHTPLGHRFCGYRLIDKARALGVCNATHNNTRGYITRLAEYRLIQAANGLRFDEDEPMKTILASEQPHVLNRVINLETGSLAVEAGVKMMLHRFYRLDESFPEPKYAGRIPVFFVMADEKGGREANYHGTTVITQTMRGLWPAYADKLEEAGLYKVVSVRINDVDDFREKIGRYNRAPYKTAGFLHEIILMNYGGIRLTREFLQAAYELCRASDTPTLVDEIQSCMWYEGMFLFRLYGLEPDFAIVGKGFPGGEYPASKILTTAEMDTLNQFGALVTNGQEELASLAYLVTMHFSAANGPLIAQLGKHFENGLAELARRHAGKVARTEGLGHLAAIHFHSLDEAKAFAGALNARCVDASAQIYKRNCPPAVLLKPPIIASREVLDALLGILDDCLS